MEVDSGIVQEELNEIEKIHNTLEKAQNSIDLARNNLDDEVMSYVQNNSQLPSFPLIKNKLSQNIENCENIINKCRSFVNDSSALVNKINDILSQSVLTNGEEISEHVIELSDDSLIIDDDYLNEEETNKLLLICSYNSGEEMSEDDIYAIINDCENLTDEDREYITNQLKMGNVRPAMQRVVVRISEQELDVVKARNQPRIDEINALLQTPYYLRDVVTNDRSLNPMQVAERFKEIIALETERDQLRGEIRSREMLVNRYKLANREWEYDCYYKLIGTEEFEKTIIPYEFFTLAREYYSSDEYDALVYGDEDIIYNTYVTTSPNALYLLEFIAKDPGAYLSWLQSDECTSPNKELLIAYYESTFGTTDSTSGPELMKILFPGVNHAESNYFFTASGIMNNDWCFTDDERKVLIYLYFTEGDAGVKKFFEVYEASINERLGAKDAVNMFQRIVSASDAGVGVLGANWEGIKVGTIGWFTRLAKIGDNSGVMTREEYAIMYENYMLSGMCYLTELTIEDFDDEEFCELYGIDEPLRNSMVEKIRNGKSVCVLDVALETKQISPEAYNDFIKLREDEKIVSFLERNKGKGAFGMTHQEWIKYSFNAGVATGNMLPSICMSIMTKGALTHLGVSPVLAEKTGRLIGLGGMWSYSYSSNKAEGIRSGRSLSASRLFAALSASGESVSEYLIGGMPILSKGVKWFKILPTDKWYVKGFKLVLDVLAVEPGMEMLQEELELLVLDPLSQYIAYGENNFKLDLNSIKDTAITTYLSTLELQVVTVAVPTVISEIKRHDVAITVQAKDGNKYDITYGELIDCADKNGNISKEKINILMKNKIKKAKSSGKSGSNVDVQIESSIDNGVNNTNAKSGGRLIGIQTESGTIQFNNVFKMTASELAGLFQIKTQNDTSVELDEKTKTKMYETRLRFESLKNGNNDAAINTFIAVYEQQMRNSNPFIQKIMDKNLEGLESGKVKIVIDESIKSKRARTHLGTITVSPNAANAMTTMCHEPDHAVSYAYESQPAKVLKYKIQEDGTVDTMISPYDSVTNSPIFDHKDGKYRYNGIEYQPVMEGSLQALNDSSNLLWTVSNQYERNISQEGVDLLRTKAAEKGMDIEPYIQKRIAVIQQQINDNGLEAVLSKYQLNYLSDGGEIIVDDQLLYRIAEVSLSFQNTGKEGVTFHSIGKDIVIKNSTIDSFQDICMAILQGKPDSRIRHLHPEIQNVDYTGKDLIQGKHTLDVSSSINTQMLESSAQFVEILSLTPQALPVLYYSCTPEFFNMVMDVVSKRYGFDIKLVFDK